MREILFKAKRVDNGEWVEGWLLKDEVTGQYFIHASGNSVNESDKVNEEGCLCFVAFEIDEHTICQYTDLTDKNGNKIWENDIVDIKHYAENAHKVKWGYGGFYVGINGLLCHYNTVCEVIGNTFDNADLLKGE